MSTSEFEHFIYDFLCIIELAQIKYTAFDWWKEKNIREKNNKQTFNHLPNLNPSGQFLRINADRL